MFCLLFLAKILEPVELQAGRAECVFNALPLASQSNHVNRLDWPHYMHESPFSPD